MMGKIHALLFLLPLVTACGGSANLELSRKFQEAQQVFSAASTREEFLQAATIYRQILDTGFTNGALLYNMGNAFMNADRRGHAIAAYRQASETLLHYIKDNHSMKATEYLKIIEAKIERTDKWNHYRKDGFGKNGS